MSNVSRLAPSIQDIISFALTSRRGDFFYLAEAIGTELSSGIVTRQSVKVSLVK